jgi:hypothetical protein
MKRYKSIFKESDTIKNENEASKIVDISELEWSETLKTKLTWDEATSNTPSGWRLPTMQELYTACQKKLPNFDEDYYWSSTEDFKNSNKAWVSDFSWGGEGQTIDKDSNRKVTYVKKIDVSYEDKIESSLIKHFKKNYNKSPKEIEAIEFFISNIVNDLENKEFDMIKAKKLLTSFRKFLK